MIAEKKLYLLLKALKGITLVLRKNILEYSLKLQEHGDQ